MDIGRACKQHFSNAFIPQNLRLKRDQVCVNCSCEARDGGRWTRGFRGGGLTRGRGPGYTCHTILCKRNYNYNYNYSSPLRWSPKHFFQNPSKKFWHHGSPFHLQAALFSIRTFFQVPFLCRSSPANFPPSTIGSADFGIQIYHSSSKSQSIRKFSKTFFSRQVTIFLFFQGPLLPTQLPFHLIYSGFLLKLTTKLTS